MIALSFKKGYRDHIDGDETEKTGWISEEWKLDRKCSLAW